MAFLASERTFMLQFTPHLLGLLLLLGTITACRRDATPSQDELHGETASANAESQEPTPLAQDKLPAPATPPTPPAPAAETLPTPEERQACLGPPLSPSPEQLPEVEGLRHTATEFEHAFLPERPGRDRLRADGVDAVLARIQSTMGIQKSYGLGMCGSAPAHRGFSCVRLTVPICEPWLEEVRRLAPVAKSEGLGILVEIQGRTGPRCTSDKPDCGPLPYHRPITDGYQEERLWSGAFTLPLRPGVALQTLRDDLSAGSCAHAGDCVRAGCGNHCDAWYQPVYGANCPGFRELADAYCGCVEGRCAWFTQPETAQLHARAEVQGWQGAIPRQPPPQPATANELFEHRLADDWMLRQMQRLAAGRTLPKHIEFSFTWHPQSRVTGLTLRADGQPAPKWLVTVFQHLSMPHPEVQPFQPVRVQGTLRVEETTEQGAQR